MASNSQLNIGNYAFNVIITYGGIFIIMQSFIERFNFKDCKVEEILNSSLRFQSGWVRVSNMPFELYASW